MSVRCGLCNKEVDNWAEHEKSEEHQRNLKDKDKLRNAFVDSQEKLVKRFGGTYKNGEDKDG